MYNLFTTVFAVPGKCIKEKYIENSIVEQEPSHTFVVCQGYFLVNAKS